MRNSITETESCWRYTRAQDGCGVNIECAVKKMVDPLIGSSIVLLNKPKPYPPIKLKTAQSQPLIQVNTSSMALLTPEQTCQNCPNRKNPTPWTLPADGILTLSIAYKSPVMTSTTTIDQKTQQPQHSQSPNLAKQCRPTSFSKCEKNNMSPAIFPIQWIRNAKSILGPWKSRYSPSDSLCIRLRLIAATWRQMSLLKCCMSGPAEGFRMRWYNKTRDTELDSAIPNFDIKIDLRSIRKVEIMHITNSCWWLPSKKDRW
jgi:hypothetical protein